VRVSNGKKERKKGIWEGGGRYLWSGDELEEIGVYLTMIRLPWIGNRIFVVNNDSICP
jgi:hypothetical protein